MSASAYHCTLCGRLVTAPVESGDACPHCGGPARNRSLPVLLRDHLAARPPLGLRESLPALVFSPTESEREVLASHFPRLTAVTLYGDYGAGVTPGIDVRDLSAFADGAFCAHLSIVLFDYFTEHEKALAEAFRVLAPGGVFATLIIDARIRDGGVAPFVVKKLEKKPGYYDYWPDGVDLLSIGVGADWLVRAIRDAGFGNARHVVIPDPISGYVSHWFLGTKPTPGLLGRLAGAVRGLARRRPSAPPLPAAACTLCGHVFAAGLKQDDCPACRAPARLRSLPLVWDRIAPPGAPFDKPLLGFALTGAERAFLAPRAPRIVSVSLHGDYGAGHISGVDVRELTRFAEASFSCVFAILLFDYFAEHEQALAQIARVLTPGGVFATAILESRLSPGSAPPAVIKTIESRPGYFDYVPTDKPLVSVQVGRDWLMVAMTRAGLAAQMVSIDDPLSGARTTWFIGVKR